MILKNENMYLFLYFQVSGFYELMGWQAPNVLVGRSIPTFPIFVTEVVRSWDWHMSVNCYCE